MGSLMSTAESFTLLWAFLAVVGVIITICALHTPSEAVGDVVAPSRKRSLSQADVILLNMHERELRYAHEDYMYGMLTESEWRAKINKIQGQIKEVCGTA